MRHRFALVIISIWILLGCETEKIVYKTTTVVKPVERLSSANAEGNTPSELPQNSTKYNDHNRAVVSAINSSNVSIETIGYVYYTDPTDSYYWNGRSGSGFLVNKSKCEFWTNNHVVENAAFIFVHKNRGKEVIREEAWVERSDPFIDFAIIKTRDCDFVTEAQLADSDDIELGEIVYAIGNPSGRNPGSLTQGIISKTHRYIDKLDIKVFQTDAAINKGNSGGGLFNDQGSIIAINSKLAFATPGVSYAVPINFAKRSNERLLNYREKPPTNPFKNFDLKDIDNQLAKAMDYEVAQSTAILIQGIVNNNILRIKVDNSINQFEPYDIITHIDNEPIFKVKDLNTKLWYDYSAGDSVLITVFRNKEYLDIQLELTPFSPLDRAERPSPYTNRNVNDYLGLDLEMWSDTSTRGQYEKIKTPIITRVHNMGPAHEGKVRSSLKLVRLKGQTKTTSEYKIYTVVGVHFGGYIPITSVSQLEDIAKKAFLSFKPIILVIDLWVDEDKKSDDPDDLKKRGRSLHPVAPKPLRDSNT